MKPEPLTKEKISTFKTEIGDYHYFEIEDVQSAVQGLLEEIEKKREDVNGEPEEDRYDTAYKNGYLNALDFCEGKIKKWFKAVSE
ncbi:hypothetical protein DRJ16_00100 [Candidatus Woesearchaeota archaeon]|nr:MAG: hypothetical protein DRJ16_00100 [Candidatus Woesearchaeota archaeon]